jgi:anion-transporting  ArsA/GET3 family ATPase
MEEARALFHDAACMRFAVVTIPTVMAAAESARLAVSLKEEGIPINTMVINQVGAFWGWGWGCACAFCLSFCVSFGVPFGGLSPPLHPASNRQAPKTTTKLKPLTQPHRQVVNPAATERFLELRRHDQARALAAIAADPELSRLQLIKAPLLDLEVRGESGLKYFGQQVWKE